MKHYYRYVDDNLVIVEENNNNAIEIVEYLNKIHENIRFIL